MQTTTVRAGPLTVSLVPSADNYIYLLEWAGGGAVVDPGSAAPVLRQIEQRGVRVNLILATHRHGDHVAGIPEVKRKTGARVVGPKGAGVPEVDREVSGGDRVDVGPVEAEVIETPGHTSTDITYYLAGAGIAFCGDTLFAGGCGRLFECGPDVMWSSLRKLRDLPGETQIFCGHEYTQDNLAFAATVDAGNPLLQDRIARVKDLLKRGEPTIPSTIEVERATNPFLRSDVDALRNAVGLADADPASVFAELRARKDRF
jgi:hydroxyacylglutathione hydrolase